MHLELISIAPLIVACIDLLLGIVILLQNPRNTTNLAYTLFAVSVASWGFAVGLFFSIENEQWIDFLARLLYFCGGSIPVTFLLFSRLFNSYRPSSRLVNILLFFPSCLFAYLYFGTDLIISGYTVDNLGVRGYTYGPYHFLFDLHLWGYFVWAFVELYLRYRRVDGTDRKHLLFVTLGTYSVLAIAGVTNVVAPIIHIFDLVWIGPTSTIIWTWVVAYAVIRHQLFNIRVIAAEMLIVSLWLLLLGRAILSSGPKDLLINALFFVATVILGTFVIRSVIKEVRQRELIQAQERELEIANQKQESLLHFISHEIKGYLTEGQNAFASIVEGDFGTAPPKVHELATRALARMRKGVETVMDILDASNLKKGTVSYKKEKLDVRAEVESGVQEMRPAAAEKGLLLELTVDARHTYEYIGDKDKLHHHVIRNLIDNAIKYTPKGSIHVTLTKTEHAIGLSVKDTGVGITDEDKPRLFTEGGHGKNSIKVNVDSTGYGLFIAKEVVEAHGGTIHVESAGAGKGSEFVVELPV